MRRLTRILGRRDVKVFLLLWAPVAWVLLLHLGDTEIPGDDHFAAFAGMLAKILGPCLLLLGVASGVDAHASTRSRNTSPGFWREAGWVLAAGIVAFISVPVTLVLFWAATHRPLEAIWDCTQGLLSLFYSPVGFYETSDPVLWEVRKFLTVPWIGWAVGYRVGRRLGRFLPSLALTGLTTGGIVWCLWQASRFPVERSTPYGSPLLPALADSMFSDIALLLAYVTIVEFLVRVLLLEYRAQKWMWPCRAGFAVLVVECFVIYRGIAMHIMEPWPAPAQKIVALDPVTHRLWVVCGTEIWNHRLFALEVQAGAEGPSGDGLQQLAAVDGVRVLGNCISYAPSVPAILISKRSASGGLSLRCRKLEGIETVELKNGDFHPVPYRVLCPAPTWYAWMDRRYETVLVEKGSNSFDREFRGRLFLYSPIDGATQIITLRGKPTLAPGDTSALVDAYQKYFRLLAPGDAEPETGGTFYQSSAGKTGLSAVACDGFLSSNPSQADHEHFRARVPSLRMLDTIAFEVFSPPADFEGRYKIPAGKKNRGCIWDNDTGTLQIYESGKLLATAIREATVSRLPSWSPDGEYLVYEHGVTYSGPWDTTLAFPEKKDIFRAEGNSQFKVWSVDGRWLAAVYWHPSGAGNLFVLKPPQFEAVLLSVSVHHHCEVQALHDGSLVYIDTGKVFQWRPGWEEPACIYDPEKETVLSSQK